MPVWRPKCSMGRGQGSACFSLRTLVNMGFPSEPRASARSGGVQAEACTTLCPRHEQVRVHLGPRCRSTRLWGMHSQAEGGAGG